MDDVITGSNNTAVGHEALTNMTGGAGNTALGKGSMAAVVTGSNNTAVGRYALSANTTASNNVAIGINALVANTTAGTNVAIGVDCLKTNTTGAENTAIGAYALQNTTGGTRNTAVGLLAMDANTTGADNVAMGKQALGANTTGAFNTAIGRSAGDSITSGSNNLILGVSCDVGSGGVGNAMVMGDSVTGVGANNFTFGNGTLDTNIEMGTTTVSTPSDVRLKEDIQDEEVGLDFINDLRPVTFLWKKEKDIPSDLRAYKEDSETRTMNGKHNHGFIAQEVKEVIDNHNLKEGFSMWKEDEVDGRQRIGESALMSVMVKAVQELSAQVEELKTQPKCKCNEE